MTRGERSRRAVGWCLDIKRLTAMIAVSALLIHPVGGEPYQQPISMEIADWNPLAWLTIALLGLGALQLWLIGSLLLATHVTLEHLEQREPGFRIALLQEEEPQLSEAQRLAERFLTHRR